MYRRKIEARSHNHFYCGKARRITYSDCVSAALVNQRAKRMGHVILSSVVCPEVSYFSTLSHKRHDFREIVTEHKMCALILSTSLCETFLILSRIE